MPGVEDFDEPFVVDYSIFFDDDEERMGGFEIASNGDPDIFRFYVTTRPLIQVFANNQVNVLQTDATYKLN